MHNSQVIKEHGGELPIIARYIKSTVIDICSSEIKKVSLYKDDEDRFSLLLYNEFVPLTTTEDTTEEYCSDLYRDWSSWGTDVGFSESGPIYMVICKS